MPSGFRSERRDFYELDYHRVTFSLGYNFSI